MTVLRGGGRLTTKVNITFFVGNEVLNIFHLTIFSQKSNIFQNNGEKLFLGGMTIFAGTDRGTTKMNITFVLGIGVPNTVFKFFSQKIPYR